MQFQANANVYTAAGDKAGVIDRVVIDPRNRQVTHIIIKKGFLFRADKVVALDMVSEAGADRVVLKPEAEAPDDLPNFAEEHYVQLANDEWAAPEATVGADPLTSGVAVAPLLYYPPAGIGNFGTSTAAGFGVAPAPAAVAVAATRQVEVERNIPEDTVPLKEGAKVVAADGETVGRVERIFTDSQSNEVTHLLISQGMFLKERKIIPMAWVLDVAEDHVRLAVGSNLLQGLRAYRE